MNTQVLLFNIKGEKLDKIVKILTILSIEAKVIDKKDFGQTLGALIGESEKTEAVVIKDFSSEMLIMVNFTRAQMDVFLGSFKAQGIEPVALKAVATQTNLAWRADDLVRELQREHFAMMNF